SVPTDAKHRERYFSVESLETTEHGALVRQGQRSRRAGTACGDCPFENAHAECWKFGWNLADERLASAVKDGGNAKLDIVVALKELEEACARAKEIGETNVELGPLAHSLPMNLLLLDDASLGDWEVGFLASLSRRGPTLSEKQAACLAKFAKLIAE